MKYEVKKGFWHCNRPVQPGEILDLDPDGARWLAAQGKIAPVSAEDEQKSDPVEDGARNKRRGRREQTNEGEQQ